MAATAAVFHFILALGLFVAGRTGIAPALINRDGMSTLPNDSYAYQSDAIQLADLLRRGRVADWLFSGQRVHVKIIAIPFAIFGRWFGYGTLAAEPYNLVCYLAIIVLVFWLGRELSGRRVGLLAAATVAVYPSFVWHTLQLFKDPLVISASLAFALCVTTWLTRTYEAKSAAIIAVLTLLMAVLLFVTRTELVIVFFGTTLLGFTLLLARQLFERRWLVWNMVLPLPILLVMVFLVISSHTQARTKEFPSQQMGPPKTNANADLQIPTLLVRVASAPKSSNNFVTRFGEQAGSLVQRAGSRRLVFTASYRDAGSFVDRDRHFKSLSEMLIYLPRAMEIGLWAPFPNTWISGGRRVGKAANLLAALETLFIYLFQMLAVWALIRDPRRLALWFLLTIATLGVTALALVVPNVGALYRLRYAFWVLLVVVAMTVVDKLFRIPTSRDRARALPLQDALMNQKGPPATAGGSDIR